MEGEEVGQLPYLGDPLAECQGVGRSSFVTCWKQEALKTFSLWLFVFSCLVQNRFHRESQPQSGESFRLGSEGLAWGRPLLLTASNTEKDNRTFHSVRKGVVSKGTQDTMQIK